MIQVKLRGGINVLARFRETKLFFKKMLAPDFSQRYPNTRMCWDDIKIAFLATTGWKVKSNMEGMPNDLEKVKDPAALVKKL